MSSLPALRAGAARVRVDPVLVWVACAVLGAALAVAPLPGLVGFGAGALALGRCLGPRWLGLALVAAGIGWARAGARLDAHAGAWQAARAALPSPARCAGAGLVTASPTQRGPTLRVDAELSGLDCEGRTSPRAWPARLYVAAGAAPPLERGSRVSVVADLAPTSDFRNADLPDPRPGAARRGAVLSGGALAVELEQRATGARALIDRARAHARARILASFAPAVSGLARALVLGESDLAPDDERAFQRSGLSHLLAVSGTHLVLAVLALVRGLEGLARRVERLSARADVRRPAAVVGLCLAPLYADFAGGSGSAWRAAYMLCAVLGARALGRYPLPSRVLALSLAGGWLGDGLVVFDPSFMLSVGATTGLLVFGRGQAQRDLARAAPLGEPRAPELPRVAQGVLRATLTTLAASLPCVPLLLSFSPGVSLASVAANLLAAPLGEAVALPLCLAHALCWPFPDLERGVALVASGALLLIRGIACASASVDWLYIALPPPGAWHNAVLASSVPLILAPRAGPWLRAARPASRGPLAPGRPSAPAASTPRAARASHTPRAARAALALSVLALVLVEAVTRWQHSAARQRLTQRLRVTALDVGQGDATLVDLPDGRLMLIDGGGNVGVPVDPGERVILPVLRARRREHVDLLVLTHPHPDHLGGLLSVARSVPVGELWDGGAPAPEGSDYERLLALLQARGVPRRAAAELCAAGALKSGAAASDTLRVLHPCPLDPARSLNENSLVLRVTRGRHAALFTGDAERWAEQRLLATEPGRLAADFLKVGHHGSRTSTSPALLAAVRPRVATLSAGIRNRFGHPHAETLAHLSAAGTLALRLDQLGSVEWQTDGVSERLGTWRTGPLQLPRGGGASNRAAARGGAPGPPGASPPGAATRARSLAASG